MFCFPAQAVANGGYRHGNVSVSVYADGVRTVPNPCVETRARLNGVVVGTVNGEVHEHVCAWTENSWRWKTWKDSFMKYAYMLT